MNPKKYTKYLSTRFPNKYKRHYEVHAKDGNIRYRKHIARIKLARMDEIGVTSFSPLELLADYLLADDHARGLSLKRLANDYGQSDEEHPPLGEGAREYHQREWVSGVPLSIGERRSAKVCEACGCKFIDRSRRKNATVCGPTCFKRKDTLRKRKEYNQTELGLQNEKRLKRYRVRQDFNYPFYSPYELHELSVRSERVYEDHKIERAHYKRQGGAEEWAVAGEVISVGKPSLNGKRKPKWSGDKFGELSDKFHKYSPSGCERFVEGSEDKSGPVIVRNINQNVTIEQLDAEKWVSANKMKGLGVLIPRHTREKANNTSEKYAL